MFIRTMKAMIKSLNIPNEKLLEIEKHDEIKVYKSRHNEVKIAKLKES